MFGGCSFFLFVFLFNDFHGKVFPLFPFNSCAETSLYFISFQLKFLLYRWVIEEFIFGEVENEREIISIFTLESLDFSEVHDSFFILRGDSFCDDIMTNQYFLPIIFDGLFGIVVILCLFFKVSQEMVNSFKISICKVKVAWDNVKDLNKIVVTSSRRGSKVFRWVTSILLISVATSLSRTLFWIRYWLMAMAWTFSSRVGSSLIAFSTFTYIYSSSLSMISLPSEAWELFFLPIFNNTTINNNISIHFTANIHIE